MWAKEIKLINSMPYDIYLENKLTISEDYIVHLDSSLNYRHENVLSGKWPQEKIEKHYYYLNKFLKKLSTDFDKELIVTIHPAYDLKEHQSYLKDFKVLKYKTTEYIYKSFMVTAFDSSAVTDAILLKKKLLGLNSNFMPKNATEHSKITPNLVGYLMLNTVQDYNFKKEDLLLKMNSNISNYDTTLSKYHCFEKNKSGTQEIVDTLKKRFFTN